MESVNPNENPQIILNVEVGRAFHEFVVIVKCKEVRWKKGAHVSEFLCGNCTAM